MLKFYKSKIETEKQELLPYSASIAHCQLQIADYYS